MEVLEDQNENIFSVKLMNKINNMLVIVLMKQLFPFLLSI